MKMHVPAVVAILFSLPLMPTSPAHADDVTDLVRKMSAASEQHNYDGVFVLRKSDSLMSMRVVHGVDEYGKWERLESLNGENRKVVRRNDEVISIFPDRRLITVSQTHSKVSIHPTLPENIGNLVKYYRIEKLGDDRVAGRGTVVLDVKPKDQLRYGYKYWLDNDTGVLLKCDLLNEDGDVVEQMMYTSFQDHDTTPESAFGKLDISDYKREQLDQEREAVKHPGWTVNELPPGFMLTQSTLRHNEKTDSLHMIYSDGLASVSVFVETGDNGHHRLNGSTSIGALNVFGQEVDDAHVTVMGEVPEATVERIAHSMARETK
jgi:sigma-E factor negative regulatory protein RseB